MNHSQLVGGSTVVDGILTPSNAISVVQYAASIDFAPYAAVAFALHWEARLFTTQPSTPLSWLIRFPQLACAVFGSSYAAPPFRHTFWHCCREP